MIALDAQLPDVRRLALRAADEGQFDLASVPGLVERGLLDLDTVWKATQAISGEGGLQPLLTRLMAIVKERAGAQRGVLVLRDGDDGPWLVQAESPEDGPGRWLQAEPYEAHPQLPLSMIRYVLRSGARLTLDGTDCGGAHAHDPYIRARRPRSMLAKPIVQAGETRGVLYLENALLSGTFTPERLAVLQILAGQAAVSLQSVRATHHAAWLEAEHALQAHYARLLEARVDERTAALSQAYEQLKELGRLKTDFLNVVSHELRTPLTGIQGFAEFLEDGIAGPLGPEQAAYVAQIQAAASRLRRLVDDLLDLAREEGDTFRLERERAELGAVLEGAVRGLRPQLQACALRLEMRLPAQPVWAHLDAGRVAQALENLLGNAIKFTPEGGRIGLTLETDGAESRVTVSDSGIGIEPSHMPKLFQRFYQVDASATRAHGGVGLGLAIARSIVVAHGGRIGADSTPGLGSTFWFTLPHGSAEAPS